MADGEARTVASSVIRLARRPSAQKVQDSAMLMMTRGVLNTDVDMMEAFAGKVDLLLHGVQKVDVESPDGTLS